MPNFENIDKYEGQSSRRGRKKIVPIAPHSLQASDYRPGNKGNRKVSKDEGPNTFKEVEFEPVSVRQMEKEFRQAGRNLPKQPRKKIKLGKKIRSFFKSLVSLLTGNKKKKRKGRGPRNHGPRKRSSNRRSSGNKDQSQQRQGQGRGRNRSRNRRGRQGQGQGPKGQQQGAKKQSSRNEDQKGQGPKSQGPKKQSGRIRPEGSGDGGKKEQPRGDGPPKRKRARRNRRPGGGQQGGQDRKSNQDNRDRE